MVLSYITVPENGAQSITRARDASVIHLALLHGSELPWRRDLGLRGSLNTDHSDHSVIVVI